MGETGPSSAHGDETDDSAASIPPGGTGERKVAAPAWRTNVALFGLTLVSVFATALAGEPDSAFLHPSHAALVHAAQFTGALLTILLAHEFGHYIAARLHKVDASLPYFIPVPILSPFGTMGAVIRMRGVIPTRKALLDIGASGPLAGLVIALPLYIWGIAHSTLVPVDSDGMQLGESIASRVLEHFFAPTPPPGMDLLLSPIAFAAWGGMLVTMINLVPVGQLDGGHVAYALFGPKQDRYAMVVHRAMLVFFFVSLGSYLFRDVRAGMGFHHLGRHVGNSMFWLVWFEMLAVLGTLSAPPGVDTGTLSIRTRGVAMLGLIFLGGWAHDKSSPFVWVAWFVGLGLLLAMEVRGGVLRKHHILDHPATGAERLGPGRAAVAIVTLVFFVLLFMPTPIAL